MRPAWDSAPGLDPNPPSKFMQERTKEAVASVSTASRRPSRARVAKAQKLNLWETRLLLN